MKRNSLLKKFDEETENLWEQLYRIKELLENTEDFELSDLANKFLDQIANAIEEDDITVEDIRERILLD
jgi:hypothetical protein|tara:strand:- start:833 stop:1039 length:207 start_codon:yes stop_codon:yes gene_type:complete